MRAFSADSIQEKNKEQEGNTSIPSDVSRDLFLCRYDLFSYLHDKRVAITLQQRGHVSSREPVVELKSGQMYRDATIRPRHVGVRLKRISRSLAASLHQNSNRPGAETHDAVRDIDRAIAIALAKPVTGRSWCTSHQRYSWRSRGLCTSPHECHGASYPIPHREWDLAMVAENRATMTPRARARDISAARKT